MASGWWPFAESALGKRVASESRVPKREKRNWKIALVPGCPILAGLVHARVGLGVPGAPSSFCEGGSWGSLFLPRGSELQLRHTAPSQTNTPKICHPDPANVGEGSLCALGVRPTARPDSGRNCWQRSHYPTPGVFVKHVKTKGIRAQECASV